MSNLIKNFNSYVNEAKFYHSLPQGEGRLRDKYRELSAKEQDEISDLVKKLDDLNVLKKFTMTLSKYKTMAEVKKAMKSMISSHVNEGRQRHTNFDAQVDIDFALGQTLQETAEFFAFLAKKSPNVRIMEIEVEDPDLNPNAGAILTLAGESMEIGELELFNMEMEGDGGRGLDRRYRYEDYAEEDYGKGSITKPPYMGEDEP